MENMSTDDHILAVIYLFALLLASQGTGFIFRLIYKVSGGIPEIAAALGVISAASCTLFIGLGGVYAASANVMGVWNPENHVLANLFNAAFFALFFAAVSLGTLKFADLKAKKHKQKFG